MSEKLIEVTRGEIVECIHNGDIAVVDSKGKLLYSVGNPNKVTYMRSSAKPIQTMNVILSGAAGRFNLTNKEIAIISSSHYGEKFHIETIESILNKIGLTKDHILGGTVTSLSTSYALQLAWERTELTPLYSDCSGKHSGMLAVCVHKNYSLHDYLKPQHPCQLEILKALSYMCEVNEDDIYIGIDGCSAPVHALPLYNMAMGYAKFTNNDKLVDSYKKAAERSFTSMNEYPEMISGTGGFCTDLIKYTNGKLMGKIGAEGVYCVGIKDRGIGFAVKMESGSMAMLPPVVIQVLKEIDILSKDELQNLKQYEVIENINDIKTVVGKIRPAFNLKKE